MLNKMDKSDRQTDCQTNKQTRQTDKSDRQTDKLTDIQIYVRKKDRNI